MGTNPVQRGAAADAVSANVKRLRSEQNLGLRALSDRLEKIRPSLRHSTIDAIERGTRRVDVDDVLALALALGVSPATLLFPGMPGAADPAAEVETAGVAHKVRADELWHWLTAQQGPPSWVGVSPGTYESNALPQWHWYHWSNKKDDNGND
jgi:transcriptional regulator with XRE-family HTH domain